MKNSIKNFSRNILAVSLLVFSTSTFAQLQSTCLKDLMNTLFQKDIGFEKSGAITEVRTAEGILRYPKNVDRVANPDWHLMYGFESEYTQITAY